MTRSAAIGITVASPRSFQAVALWPEREHRGDGHNIVRAAHGIGGSEAHVLMALAMGMRAEEFGRINHLPPVRVAAVVDRSRACGLVDAEGWFSDAGRELREQIESQTDELARPCYDVLSPDDLDELIVGLEPIAQRL